MELNPVLAELGTYPIAEVRERAARREAEGLSVIDFSIGDPREPTPPFIVDALKDGVPDVSQYPTSAGMPELRDAIAQYVARRHGVTVDPSTQIIPTSGSKEAIFSTPLAFIDRDAGDGVIYPTPGYPVYASGAKFAGAKVHPLVLDGDFVMRAESVSDDAWATAKLTWICTPHNPSGSVMSTDDLVAMHAATRRAGSLLLSDECYADTYEPDVFPGGPPSVLQIAGPRLTGVLVYLSLSKRSGMTGYRSGAIVGDAAAIAALKALRATTGTASSSIIQNAAIAAWSDDQHAAVRRDVFAAKRRLLERAFHELDMEIVGSAAGLYLWVRVDDDIAVSDRLLDHGIVVSPGSFFGEGGEGYIRLALVPGLEECASAADALTSALS